MFELSSTRLSKNARLVRIGLLGFCCTPLIGSYFYNQGYRLPFLVCPLRYWTGLPCPTCGMTRSFIAIAQADWHQAVAQNLFGPLLFASFLIAAVHIIVELLTRHHLAAFYEKLIKRRKLQHLSIIIFLGYYVLRLYYLCQTGELSLAFEKSPLGEWFALTMAEFF
jgi:SNF family Na+-dependent transporter